MHAKYLIILNKAANNGKTRQLWPQIKESLDDLSFNYLIRSTKYPNHANSITNYYLNFATKENILLVIGGDGTLSEVINSIKSNPNNQKTPPIAYIPTGNKNLFAKANNIPLNWQKAIHQIRKANQIKFLNIGHFRDTVKNHDFYFINENGIGLDAEINNKITPKKSNFRYLKLLFNAVDISYNLQSFPITLYQNNKRTHYRNAFIVNIANHPISGKKSSFYPKSQLNDGNLDLIIMEKRHFLNNIVILFKFLMNKPLKNKGIHFFHQTNFHIVVSSLEYGQIDGENIGSRFYDSYYNVIKYPFYF